MAEYYILTKIEGEYAYIKRESDGEELFIALYLLPAGADIGTHLKCENLEFSII